MADLNQALQTLPPSALEVLRFFDANGNAPSDAIDIMSGTSLSERTFDKSLRRLVTRGYAQMTGERVYTLTRKGLALATHLVTTQPDAGAGGVAAAPAVPSTPVMTRRLVVVVPTPLLADDSAQVFVGLNAPQDGHSPDDTMLALRLSVVGGGVAPTEVVLPVGTAATHETVLLTAGTFRTVRLRVQAYQFNALTEGVALAGGLYVDLDVSQDPMADGQLSAFGTDLTLVPHDSL